MRTIDLVEGKRFSAESTLANIMIRRSRGMIGISEFDNFNNQIIWRDRIPKGIIIRSLRNLLE